MKFIFLDRDGVINEFPGNGNYVTKVKNFRFIPGSLDALKFLTDEGYIIFIISNQAGVGKGVYSKSKLDHITRNMLRDVRNYGADIKGVYYCIHKSDEGCGCRKPEDGSMRKALKSVGKTIRAAKGTFFIGDTKSDIFTGHRVGCETILVLSGRAKRSQIKDWGVKPDYVAKDLFAAMKIVTGKTPKLYKNNK